MRFYIIISNELVFRHHEIKKKTIVLHHNIKELIHVIVLYTDIKRLTLLEFHDIRGLRVLHYDIQKLMVLYHDMQKQIFLYHYIKRLLNPDITKALIVYHDITKLMGPILVLNYEMQKSMLLHQVSWY